jgi:hypothetical protein
MHKRNSLLSCVNVASAANAQAPVALVQAVPIRMPNQRRSFATPKKRRESLTPGVFAFCCRKYLHA